MVAPYFSEQFAPEHIEAARASGVQGPAAVAPVLNHKPLHAAPPLAQVCHEYLARHALTAPPLTGLVVVPSLPWLAEGLDRTSGMTSGRCLRQLRDIGLFFWVEPPSRWRAGVGWLPLVVSHEQLAEEVRKGAA